MCSSIFRLVNSLRNSIDSFVCGRVRGLCLQQFERTHTNRNCVRVARIHAVAIGIHDCIGQMHRCRFIYTHNNCPIDRLFNTKSAYIFDANVSDRAQPLSLHSAIHNLRCKTPANAPATATTGPDRREPLAPRTIVQIPARMLQSSGIRIAYLSPVRRCINAIYANSSTILWRHSPAISGNFDHELHVQYMLPFCVVLVLARVFVVVVVVSFAPFVEASARCTAEVHRQRRRRRRRLHAITTTIADKTTHKHCIGQAKIVLESCANAV